jgi:nitrate reductase delta subunit
MQDPYALFAEILDYPTPGLRDQAPRLSAGLSSSHPDAAARVREFERFFDGVSGGELEQLYTSAFDFDGSRCLYVGHHLFEEDHLRSLFMVKLKERYRRRAFSAGKELPDHLCVMLKYLAGAGEAECRDLITEYIVPALTKMLDGFPPENHPYEALLQSLLLMLMENEKVDRPQVSEKSDLRRC